jgi:hypothetical protein
MTDSTEYTEYTEEQIKEAYRIAELWHCGKMIGGDPYDIVDILLMEIYKLNTFKL